MIAAGIVAAVVADGAEVAVWTGAAGLAHAPALVPMRRAFGVGFGWRVMARQSEYCSHLSAYFGKQECDFRREGGRKGEGGLHHQ